MEQTRPRLGDKLIPWYIVLFFTLQTVLFGSFAYIAQKTHTGLVTEQAYEKGLSYNVTIQKSRQQDDMGITSSISAENGEILFLIESTSKIDRVQVQFFRPAHDGIDFTLEMTEKSRGMYSVKPSLPEKGLWEIRVLAQTDIGPYQATKRLVIE